MGVIAEDRSNPHPLLYKIILLNQLKKIMKNEFETMPEPVQPEESQEGEVDDIKEEIVEEGQEPKPEGEVDSNPEEHTEKPKEEEEKVAAEIELKFRDALTLLYVRIQLRKSPEKEFPDKKELAELLEEIDLFSKMELGAKKMLLAALNKEKEFRSDDEEEFVDKGMEIEILALLMHTAMLKQAGDARLERKADEVNQARQAPSAEASTNINQTSPEQVEE